MDAELERLYDLLYLLPVGIVAFDDSGAVEAANPLAVQLLNPFVSPADAVDATRLLAPLVDDLMGTIDAATDLGEVLSGHRTTLVAGDQDAVTIELTVHRTRPGANVAVLTDVTELVRTERELRRERDRISHIVEMVREYAIYTLERSGAIDSWNASGERLFGVSADEALGNSIGHLLALDDAVVAETLDGAVFAGWRRVDGWSRRPGPGGEPFFTDTMVSTLVDAEGRPEGFAVITRDSTEAKRREEELRREAHTDPLTGLANRRGFEARSARYLAACEMNESAATVLMIDVDHFKSFNDTHGHDGGDVALRAVAAVLASGVRSMDVVGRLGGEEFAVLLPGADTEAGRLRAESLRRAVEELRVEVARGTSVGVTISVGVAGCAGDLAESLQRADQALYLAKHRGRNQVVVAGVTGVTPRPGVGTTDG